MKVLIIPDYYCPGCKTKLNTFITTDNENVVVEHYPDLHCPQIEMKVTIPIAKFLVEI